MTTRPIIELSDSEFKLAKEKASELVRFFWNTLPYRDRSYVPNAEVGIHVTPTPWGWGV